MVVSLSSLGLIGLQRKSLYYNFYCFSYFHFPIKKTNSKQTSSKQLQFFTKQFVSLGAQLIFVATPTFPQSGSYCKGCTCVWWLSHSCHQSCTCILRHDFSPSLLHVYLFKHFFPLAKSNQIDQKKKKMKPKLIHFKTSIAVGETVSYNQHTIPSHTTQKSNQRCLLPLSFSSQLVTQWFWKKA